MKRLWLVCLVSLLMGMNVQAVFESAHMGYYTVTRMGSCGLTFTGSTFPGMAYCETVPHCSGSGMVYTFDEGAIHFAYRALAGVPRGDNSALLHMRITFDDGSVEITYSETTPDYNNWYMAYLPASGLLQEYFAPAGKSVSQVEFISDNPESTAVVHVGLLVSFYDICSADFDWDQDGLSNADERLAGTDYFVADTDGDGVSDADEVQLYLTDPTQFTEVEYWYVGPSEYRNPAFPAGSQFNPYAFIGTAVANMANGDTVRLYPGVYNEAVHLYRNDCTIEGIGMVDAGGEVLPAAIIDATGLGGAGIRVGWDKHGVTLRNLLVRGADGTGEVEGSGISLRKGYGHQLIDVVCEDNATYGVSAFWSEDLVVDNSLFRDNGLSGVSFYRSSGVVSGNASLDNGSAGVRLWEAHDSEVVGNLIEGNSYGVGVHGSVAEPANDVLVMNNDLHGNHCGISVGGECENVQVLSNEVFYCTWIGVYVESTAVIDEFVGNHVWQAYGDFVRIDPNADIIVDTPNYYHEP